MVILQFVVLGAFDKVGQPRYTDLMRVVELRLLLALILVLFGATGFVGLNVGDDDNPMAVQGQKQRQRADSEEKALTSVELPSSALHPSRTDSKIAPRSCASVLDLVCVRRC